MRILHVINSMDPKGGGMAEVVRQFSAALPETSTALSLDDAGEPWMQNTPFRTVALGRATGSHAHHRALIPWLQTHAPEFDAVIAHGLWQHQTFATRSALLPLRKPYFVFPHGMLDSGLKKNYPVRHFKKWLYWMLRESAVIRDARAVLFTCEEERQLACNTFRPYRCREEVVSLGIQAPPGEAASQMQAYATAFPELAGKRVLLFLGRLHDKKGCDLLIRAFGDFSNSLRSSRPPFHLVMAGPPSSSAYLRELQTLAAATCSPDSVSFPGMLTGKLKWGALRSAEAFVLPSHQENFGIVVVEALACGTPVLISNKVNIWREIEADGAGLVSDDNESSTRSLLEVFSELSADERRKMSASCLPCFSRRFEIRSAADHLINVIGKSIAE